MLRKRLIGVIAVADGWAVQSIGYTRILPLGRAEVVAENLDRWGVDEIMVLALDRSRRGLGPDLQLVKRLASLGLSTPLSYGGGIATWAQATAVARTGVERVCIDSLLHDLPAEVPELSRRLGAQALVAALPMSIGPEGLRWYDHRTRSERTLAPEVLELLKQGHISEVLLVDWRREGIAGGFRPELLSAFVELSTDLPTLVYGGISEPSQIRSLLAYPSVAAVCVGNFLNYREHAVQHLKQEATSAALRPATFEGPRT